jgi:hypothetical protein
MIHNTPTPMVLEWPSIVPTSILPLREEADRIWAERGPVVQAVREAEAAEHQAPHDDRAEAARATRERRALPAVSCVQQARERVTLARTNLQGMDDALWSIQDEVEVAVEANRPMWLAALEAAADQDRADYAAAVEAMVEARARLDRTRAEVQWLLRFPRKPVMLVPTAPVAALATESGNAFGFAQVAAALRADAQG